MRSRGALNFNKPCFRYWIYLFLTMFELYQASFKQSKCVPAKFTVTPKYNKNLKYSNYECFMAWDFTTVSIKTS